MVLILAKITIFHPFLLAIQRVHHQQVAHFAFIEKTHIIHSGS